MDDRPRDPRFDPRCSGSKDSSHFTKNYSFVNDIRRKELNELERAFKKERDGEKKVQIKSTIQRIKNKMVEQENKLKKRQIEAEIKSAHKNVSKSYLKKKMIVEKFKELKESGKLTKYLERKRKKLKNRDSKTIEI